MTTSPSTSRLRLGAAALVAAATLAFGAAPVAAGQPPHASNQPQLHGSTYTLQNYFNSAGELTPFFDEYSGRVGPKVEIPAGYIYDIDIAQRSISMSWNTDAEWDIFEPYVGALAGVSQELAAQLPIADEYWITFSKPVSDFVFTPDPTMPLVPTIRVVDDYTIVVSIPGGTTIGDGFDAVIDIARS